MESRRQGYPYVIRVQSDPSWHRYHLHTFICCRKQFLSPCKMSTLGRKLDMRYSKAKRCQMLRIIFVDKAKTHFVLPRLNCQRPRFIRIHDGILCVNLTLTNCDCDPIQDRVDLLVLDQNFRLNKDLIGQSICDP